MTSLQQLDWPALIFTAAANNETFEDVQVVTARSEFLNAVYETAVELSIGLHARYTRDTLDAFARMLIAVQKVQVQEFVRVDDTGITVCLNVETTEQDDMMWRALERVSSALEQLDQSHGTVYFGQPLRFTLSEVGPLIKQMAW